MLKVKDDTARKRLESLGCFNGNETMFTLTKGDWVICTITYTSQRATKSGLYMPKDKTANWGYDMLKPAGYTYSFKDNKHFQACMSIQ